MEGQGCSCVNSLALPAPVKNRPHLVALYVTDLPLDCCTALTEVAILCLVEYCETVHANHKPSGWESKTTRLVKLHLGSRAFFTPRNPSAPSLLSSYTPYSVHALDLFLVIISVLSLVALSYMCML